MNNKEIITEYYKSINETPVMNIETLPNKDVQILVNVIKKKLWIILSEVWYWTLKNSWMFFEWYPNCTWDYKIDKDIIEKDILIAKLKKWKNV